MMSTEPTLQVQCREESCCPDSNQTDRKVAGSEWGRVCLNWRSAHQVQLEVLMPLSEVVECDVLIWTDRNLYLHIQEVSLQPEAGSKRLQPRSPLQTAQYWGSYETASGVFFVRNYPADKLYVVCPSIILLTVRWCGSSHSMEDNEFSDQLALDLN